MIETKKETTNMTTTNETAYEVRFIESYEVYRVVNSATGIAREGDYETESAAWEAFDAFLLTLLTDHVTLEIQTWGCKFAAREAEIWADQNDVNNSNRPREMDGWQRGTIVASHVVDALSIDIPTSDGYYSDVLVDAIEAIADDAAAERWQELAEEFNA